VKSGDEVSDVGVESDEGDQERHDSEETLVEKGA
jgi:hypothetical protein